MDPLPPHLEEIVSALVDYARIFNEQSRLLSRDPEALSVAARDESNRFHLPPMPYETTQEQLERLSAFCHKASPESVNARVRILNAATACIEIVQRDILDMLSNDERLLVLEKYDTITKAAAVLAIHHACLPTRNNSLEPHYRSKANGATVQVTRNKRPSILATLPLATRPITSNEHASFAAYPFILVGRKFIIPVTDEVVEILDFGIKVHAGQVLDVAISSSHAARWETTLSWQEAKELLIGCRAVW